MSVMMVSVGKDFFQNLFRDTNYGFLSISSSNVYNKLDKVLVTNIKYSFSQFLLPFHDFSYSALKTLTIQLNSGN